MAILTQVTGEQTLFLGWYGRCPEGIGSTAMTLDLLTSEYDNGSQARWGDGSLFHTKLARVTQVEAAGKGFGYFDQIGLESWIQIGLPAASYPGNAFSSLIPGKAYMITIRAAPGATGSIQSTISIPEFYWTKIGENDSTLRLTDNCYEG